ncbi:ATP phosphoribosyltransferase regulatory subunit [Synechococcus sp. RSCCF101]|uniref:ATP phosphoribosyltransferase regulatory subunit n=1 Tax=Synechococcus sp. RSCCF101 TaxID=2511069 RepID=UPI0012446E26|nr:ATP phosphoribosyltransferase regulatory subunit [Synechococcus sp. RSCCF101]QEY31696.1 ATP phosphoribosyltransferase regulatory subunit [Synechococcus sp. RSCCF101]
MALQPAAGVRDLNPRQVAINHRLTRAFASVYQRWGYEEVSPPRVERLDTLLAGGAIRQGDVVQLVADEPLGLRPEMTASIARAACSRLAARPRPLRLWSSGTTFLGRRDEAGGLRLEERLQSGVELIGEASTTADRELLHLLLDALASIPLEPAHRPQLLLGHHGLVMAVLDRVAPGQRRALHDALTGFDPLALARLDLEPDQRAWMQQLLRLRGEPESVLPELTRLLGPHRSIRAIEEIAGSVVQRAGDLGMAVQIDPTFQPHFELYDGMVFQLVCQGRAAPVMLASGGRYDGVLQRFGASGPEAAGVGFSIMVDEIRDLLEPGSVAAATPEAPRLVVYGAAQSLEQAFACMRRLHAKGQRAEVHLPVCAGEQEAAAIAAARGCAGVSWAGSA